MRRQNNFSIAMSPDPFPVQQFRKRVWRCQTTHPLPIYNTSSIYPALPSQCQHETLIEATQISACLILYLAFGSQNNFLWVWLIPNCTHSHTHIINNAYPITCNPYAKFWPDWSINEFGRHNDVLWVWH